MKQYFTKTLEHHQQHLLFQGHSHHCWPDIAYAAMNDYQNLVQKKLDDKWEDVFSLIIPKAQKICAKLLGWPHPKTISFGSNTYELLLRLLSSLPKQDHPLKILTTVYEYHSARRLFQSLQTSNLIQLHAINCDWKAMEVEVHKKLLKDNYDVVFISHSFYQSGYTLPEKLFIELAQKYPQTYFIIDCYHSFAARDLNFTSERKNLALLAGGYKYAMSGEGCCFLAVHPDANLTEPLFNGWMAEFSMMNKNVPSILEAPPLTKGHYRFMGATFDPIGLFRFISTWEYFEHEKITPFKIKKHVSFLQKFFLETIDPCFVPSILLFKEQEQGNFLTFVCINQQAAEKVVKFFKNRNVYIDSRDQYVRFGFSIYIEKSDVLELSCLFNAQKEELKLNFSLPS